MLEELKLSPLQTRRRNARLCLLFKINKGLTPLVTPVELKVKTTQRRTDNDFSYDHFLSHSDPLFSSFYPRTVRDWNSLDSSLVSLTCVDTFSEKLSKLQPVVIT